jgi:hypothetical protein
MRLTSHKSEAVLAATVMAIVFTSGCLSSLPFGSTATPTPTDLSGSYDASFVLSNWSRVSKFAQVKPNTYVGIYKDTNGQKWNFTVELMSSENDAYGRYYELLKDRTDVGYVKTNESKIDLGNGQTFFGRVDEKWYGYSAVNSTNAVWCALFFGYDNANTSWVVTTAVGGPGAASVLTASQVPK